MKRPLQCLHVTIACAMLGGCALGEKMQKIAGSVSQVGADIQARHEGFERAVSSAEARRAAQDVKRPWLVGAALPLAREVTLPLALRENVNTTLVFGDGPMDLSRLAQRVATVTNIPVYVAPDALLPLEHFGPRLAVAGPGANAPMPAPVMASLSGKPEPLARILDRVSARLGVMWRYENERIEFYRTETRVFNVRALTLNASAEASLGLGTSTQADGFSSTSKTSLTSSTHDLLAVVRARIEPFLSLAGILVAEAGASSSIVVTDMPPVLQRISRYLDQENRSLTRRVRLVFEELTVVLSDQAEAGLDWNLVFSSAKAAVALAMPGSAMADTGSLSVGLNHGPFQGSDAMVKALSQVGQVVRRSSMPVFTLNRRPVTHAVRTTFSYIDKVQTTALATGSGLALPSVSVSQREETVGSLITLVPDAQDDGQILLSVAYDNTVAQPLKSVTFGDRENPLQLQQITIDGNGTVQQVALQPGQPLLISGFDRSQEETEGRRLNPGIPIAFGGSDRAATQRLMTIMVVTAQVEEGY
jgi:type IVB pilus formation R64 PilN family outer membrane protein